MPKKQNQRTTSKIPLWFFIIPVIMILVVAGAIALIRPTDQGSTMAREISVAQAVEKRSAGAFILDVRQPDEWNQFHIPGATLIPLDQLETRLNEVPKDQEIVVVCRSGNRSQEGRDILLNAGYQQVTSMAGGMLDWIEQGFPAVSGP